MILSMAMEKKFSQTEHNMKVCSTMVKKDHMESLYSMMETFTMENF